MYTLTTSVRKLYIKLVPNSTSRTPAPNTGYEHHQRTKNDIVMWQICCRIVVSSSVGGVRIAGVRVVEFGPYCFCVSPCQTQNFSWNVYSTSALYCHSLGGGSIVAFWVLFSIKYIYYVIELQSRAMVKLRGTRENGVPLPLFEGERRAPSSDGSELHWPLWNTEKPTSSTGLSSVQKQNSLQLLGGGVSPPALPRSP